MSVTNHTSSSSHRVVLLVLYLAAIRYLDTETLYPVSFVWFVYYGFNRAKLALVKSSSGGFSLCKQLILFANCSLHFKHRTRPVEVRNTNCWTYFTSLCCLLNFLITGTHTHRINNTIELRTVQIICLS